MTSAPPHQLPDILLYTYYYDDDHVGQAFACGIRCSYCKFSKFCNIALIFSVESPQTLMHLSKLYPTYPLPGIDRNCLDLQRAPEDGALDQEV